MSYVVCVVSPFPWIHVLTFAVKVKLGTNHLMKGTPLMILKNEMKSSLGVQPWVSFWPSGSSTSMLVVLEECVSSRLSCVQNPSL